MNALAKQPEGTVAHAAAEPERAYVVPEVNIWETRDGYILEAEMPGVNKSGLEITLEGNTLTLVGHRGDAPPAAQPYYRESTGAHFRRVFELDPAIDTGKLNAKIDQGLLTLTLPKTDKVKPRRIAVTD